MLFQEIRMAGGASGDPDPVASPALVQPETIKATPPTLSQTDHPPTKIVLALDGVATQTCSVQIYALEERGPLSEDPPAAAREFVVLAAAVTVTAGAAAQIVPCFPGKLYFRCTSKPAADSRLLIGYAAG